MNRLILFGLLCLPICNLSYAQKTWVDGGVTITKLDTIGDGYEALRGSFIVQNSSIYEVMNLILDVDGYDWVEGESTSKMLRVNEMDSSFTFDFFVRIPWLFIKKTGRVIVDIHFDDDTFYTKSTQIKDYDRKKGYDLVDFYSAQWKLQKSGERNVKVTYLGIYQDQKMLININGIIINRIRKRLNGTFQNLIVLASEKANPSNKLLWPTEPNQSN
ncbi:SRPBCC family protein [Roseivirga misakiensis]|uniref:START domain-containing protein n=1 Tax=Roseivirga misakiensis TaxID=1563681 RepID=A0A1E5T0H4_9BACT|nr:hypothetical protein [Roseivirga misakiensis]OEK04874.1 hypothetical protein BFP71_15660 [Roseivirga misakiensis]